MRTLAAIGSRLAALHAVALPAVALAQTQVPLTQPAPPGGASGAWPLGLIVLLVAIVAAFGVYMSRKGRGPMRGGPPPHTP
jgi:apolipoprotein N-acyltransferase